MKQLNFLLMVILLVLAGSIQAQNYINGYDKDVDGVNFAYPSPYSYNNECYLTRAHKDVGKMEWQTDEIPTSLKSKTVSFIWVYGIDVTPDPQQFKLWVNSEEVLTFANPTHSSDEARVVHGTKDITLSFFKSMVDNNGDEMGYAVLTVPKKIVKLGEPVNVKIDGVDNNSAAWYMTYKIKLSKDISISQLKTVKRQNNKLFNTLRFDIVHLAETQKAEVWVGQERKEINLQTGLNEIDFDIPKVTADKTVTAGITIGKDTKSLDVALKPVNEWTVYLIQHSHTDIGYTRQQSEILAEHLRYIDDALDFCDQTDHYPKDAQFRWTCEVSWTVREYINSRPQQQVDRLLKRIKEGRIEVAGMFLNFAEIVDETALAIQLQALKDFKDQGIDVTTAMQNDVNGIGWCMPDMYENTGVKYLTMGVHAHRARLPFNKPTSFWWESPSGKKMLAYRSEHYMHGNALSLTSGELDVFRSNLSKYLTQMEEKEYPFNKIAFQFSGYMTDNSPPSTKACDIIKEWNEKYEWPKLRSSLASEFMVYMEENHPDKIETKRQAWPDWWTDGFGSSMKETKVSRNTHAEMLATMGILSMAKASGGKISEQINNEVLNCYDNLLLYGEHTFGASESIRDPESKNSMDQWSQKSSYVWMANQQANLLREKAIGLVQPYVDVPKMPSVTVFNTLNWKRTGVAEAFIDYDLLPLDGGYIIVDSKGNKIPSQLISRRWEGSRWALWVEDVPAMGYATYRILPSNDESHADKTSLEISNTVENQYYKVGIDESKNGITSIFDKELKMELVDQNSPHKLGSFIYELLETRSSLERLTGMIRDTVYRPLNKRLVELQNFEITGIEEGEIWTSIKCHADIPECAGPSGLNIEIRLYNQKKEVELLYNMRKNENTNPEGVFIAFPFANDNNGELVFEAQGGIVRPGVDQLAGSSSDWNTIQNFVAVKSDDAQIAFNSSDIPLVHFGGINTGRYYYKLDLDNAHIYSWVLNNYWTTNFKASQFGELDWKYQFTSTRDKSNAFSTQFGWGNRVPLVTRTNAGRQDANVDAESKTFVELNTPKNLLLVSSRPAFHSNGVVLHLRETEGDHAILDVHKLLENPTIKAVYNANALGEKLDQITSPLLIEHWETRFILLETEK
ncbi:glycoside hydrolase family 38 N-terminal domain-containing protein [Seonamhaeicola aphaedonensis]|nr:glycoside hydrolase family 38 C-terminal domain-containing protein [Seonamhaeicola aphaedonensis]